MPSRILLTVGGGVAGYAVSYLPFGWAFAMALVGYVGYAQNQNGVFHAWENNHPCKLPPLTHTTRS